MASTFSIDLSDKEERLIQSFLDLNPDIVGFTPKTYSRALAQAAIEEMKGRARIMNREKASKTLDTALEKLTCAEVCAAINAAVEARP